MSHKHYHVVGVPTFAPSAPPRLEFSDFVKDENVLNLYLLALASIQNDKEERDNQCNHNHPESNSFFTSFFDRGAFS